MARERQTAGPGRSGGRAVRADREHERERERERVVVVGAGVGGLAAAIDLARQGVEVVVLERGPSVGGKLHEVRVDGRAIDSGPTVFTLRRVFDALFDAAGASLDDHLRLAPLDLLARHAWTGSDALDLHADVARSADAIGRFAGAVEARRFLAFAARAASVFRTLDAPFMQAERPTPFGLAARVGWRGLPDLARISPFATLAGTLATAFEDRRLAQLFGRYATYVGSSPYAAPATLMLVAHVEQQGVWRVEGGMQRLAEALAALARRLGATVRTGAHVREIVVRDGRAAGVRLAGPDAANAVAAEPAETIAASAVVFAGDVAALGAGLLGPTATGAAEPVAPADRSLSALTWSAVGGVRGFDLAHHTVFFSEDGEHEFADLFSRRRLPADPTVYVCAADRGPGDAPADADGERLFVLVNAPADADRAPLGSQEIDRCRSQAMQTLARAGAHLDLRPERTVATTPSDFARRFPGSAGALYGRATHGWAATFRRPGSRSRLPGLYLAGGTVHPGAGLPMAALSGRLAAASLMEDRPARAHASTPMSPPAATRGGTSTR